MMLDDRPLFASGPCRLQLGSWQRQLVRRSLPGLDGELVLDLGRRARTLRQTGRLQRDTPTDMADAAGAISACQDGRTHTLTDNHGIRYENVLMAVFELTTPIQAGRGLWADYSIEYLQLP